MFGSLHGQGQSAPQAAHHSAVTGLAYPPSREHHYQNMGPSHHGAASGQVQPYDRSTIPGLAFGYPAVQDPTPVPGSTATGAENHAGKAIAKEDTMTIYANTAPKTDSSSRRSLEAGEISENDMEDLYEPEATVFNETHPQATPILTGQAADTRQPAEGANSHWKGAPQESLRHRSRSYSPRLSPSEVPGPSSTGPSRPSEPPKMVAWTSSNGAPSANVSSTTSQTYASVEDARLRARDAVKHLWPLNFRLGSFVEKGIDSAVVQSLLRDLGLDSAQAEATLTNTAQDDKPESHMLETRSGAGQTATKRPVGADSKATAEQPVSKPSDPSEERKDRIARLLAAKGTKSSTTTSKPSPAVSAPSPVQPPAPKTTVKLASPVPQKTQTEKSKILEQKLQALKKAREARASLLASVTKEANHVAAAVADASGLQVNAEPDTQAQTAEPRTNQPDVKSVSNEKPAAPIALPLLSSASEADKDIGHAKRQAEPAGRLHDGAFKRPFGQPRQAQPLLIDVSDDDDGDDDAEMELDSNEHDSPAASPSFMPALLVSQEGSSSPKTSSKASESGISGVSTPAKASSEARHDLSSMQKKIEEMKRMIAEAEARKKARTSSATPMAEGTAAQGGVTESPNDASNSGHISNGNGTSVASLAGSPVLARLSMDVESVKLPKAADARDKGKSLELRARSRAASERLPTLMASRKEQMLKLQNLQLQVGLIEKSIQDSLEEEERLRDLARSETASRTSQEPAQQSDEQSGPKSPSPMDSAALETSEVVISNSSARLLSDTELPKNSESPTHLSSGDDPRSQSVDEEMSDAPSLQDHSQSTALEDGSEDEYEPVEAKSPIGSSTDDLPGDADVPASSLPGQALHDLAVSDLTDTEGPTIEDIQVSGQAPANMAAPSSGFVPYETPLRYFHAYRFHPSFRDEVAGGLRSLTYSNKLDVRKPFCPDQLAGRTCTNATCEFQHFDDLQTPDDQILLQLGACADYDDETKSAYMAGLRQLLTDFRTQKVKDFQTISQGIIAYRAKFLGDDTRILPLGKVNL